MGREQDVRLARVYEAPSPDDGRRVLVDRLWPRGVRKDDPRVDEWLRDVAPSNELRRWYGHEPSLFEEFARRYRGELAEPIGAKALERVRGLVEAGRVTLVTATREPAISHLTVLARLLTETDGRPPRTAPGAGPTSAA
ncbi:DUF488 domain-containing protein [Terrabacter sp. BE26]|uniref:DUF488 domain-containing protein n=1 Tax=Terrabacter sp. BE26 TaxID=2898152 RepID=UPI0035BE48B0